MKAFMMDGLEGDDREVFEPIAERLVDKIFGARANPRTIITPLAVTLAKAELRWLEAETIHG